MLKKIFFLILGIALIPACLGSTEAVWIQIEKYDLLFKYRIFGAGLACYLIVFVLFHKPIKAYVYGHEITHALATWLFRGEVTGFSTSSHGGNVRVSKTNIIIVLSPYFFPFYTFLVMVLYFVLSAFFDISAFFSLVVFLIGFSWGFHLLLTGFMLVKGQQDIEEFGAMFSLVFIYFINIIIFNLIIVFIAKEITIDNSFFQIASQIQLRYLALIS